MILPPFSITYLQYRMTTETGKTPDVLLNPVLAFIHSLFLNTDKLKIREETLKIFDLVALKNAHKDVFTYLQPEEHYGYNGPRVSDRDKAVHAFDQIYGKIQEADATRKVIFACPSRDLRMLPAKQTDNHVPCIEKFNNLQRQIDDMKTNFQLLLSSQEKGKPTSILNRPPNFQANRPLVASTPVRSRSASVKRARLPSPVNDATSDITQWEDAMGNESWEVVNRHRSKKAKLDAGPSAPINGPKPAREVVIGRGQSSPSGFRGVPPKPRFVPQAFLFRCDPDSTDEIKVFNHLSKQMIHVLNVKQVSHPQSKFKSFRITVEKHEDYNKIISGNFIPQYVRVKRYVTPQSERGIGNNINYFRGPQGGAVNSDGQTQDQEYRQKISDLASTLDSARQALESRQSEADPIQSVDPVRRTVNHINAVTAASSLVTDTLTREQHNDSV